MTAPRETSTGTPVRALEVERKLDAADGFVLPDLSGLPGVASVVEAGTHDLDATYFDTADLRLAAARLTLRRRTGGTDAGWHLKRPAGAGARTEERYPLGRAARTVPPALRSATRVVTRGEGLAPVVRLRTRRVVHHLLDAQGTVLAEVAQDHVSASRLSPGGRTATVEAWNELEVELAGGRRKLLDAAVAALVAAGATPSASASKLSRALGELAPPPAPWIAAANGHRGTTGRSAGAAVTGYLRQQVGRLVDLDPAVRADEPDAVHQMRVTCRRLRSVLATWRPVLDREVTDPLRAELAWLGNELGAARDAEVVRDHLTSLAGSQPPELLLGPVVARITTTFGARYRAAHEEVLAELDGDRYAAVVDALVALLADPPLTDQAGRPARKVLAATVAHSFRRVEKLVGRIDGEHPDDPLLHEVRKAAKRARYAAEAVVDVFGPDAKAFAKQMEAVQEVLGDHQDSVVIREELRRLAVEAFADGENAFSYGRLHALEQARGESTTEDFLRVWRSASASRHRRWLT